MMGTKARLFTPLPSVTLDELVPADHFYRHLDRILDLSFVRDLVQDCYACPVLGGQVSIRGSFSNSNWSCSLRAFAPSASSCAWRQTG